MKKLNSYLRSSTSLAALAAGMGILLIEYFDVEEELEKVRHAIERAKYPHLSTHKR